MPQKSNIEHFWTDEERQWHLRFLVSFLWSTRLKEPTSDFQPDPIFEKEPCTPFPFLKMTADMRHSAIPWPIISAWNQLHAEICYSEAARITTITEKWNVGDFLSEPVGCQKSSGQLTCMLTCCKKKSMAYSKSRPRKLRYNFKWKTLIAYLSISVLWTSKMARIQNDILYTLAWVFLSHEMHLCLFWVFISHQLALFHSSSTR